MERPAMMQAMWTYLSLCDCLNARARKGKKTVRHIVVVWTIHQIVNCSRVYVKTIPAKRGREGDFKIGLFWTQILQLLHQYPRVNPEWKWLKGGFPFVSTHRTAFSKKKFQNFCGFTKKASHINSLILVYYFSKPWKPRIFYPTKATLYMVLRTTTVPC